MIARIRTVGPWTVRRRLGVAALLAGSVTIAAVQAEPLTRRAPGSPPAPSALGPVAAAPAPVAGGDADWSGSQPEEEAAPGSSDEQGEESGQESGQEQSSSLAPFIARLEKLDPLRPRMYFELAEDVASAVKPDRHTRRLARELCVIGFEIWRRDSGTERARDPRLGPSSLLLLASMADEPDHARWLRAMAAAVDSQARLTADRQTPTSVGRAPDAAVIDLVSALESLRAGEGRRAAKLMDRPEVKQLFDRYQRLLSPAGVTGESERMRRLADQWPICPECRNRRFVRGPGGISLCPTCQGDPGPPFTSLEVLYQLRLEAALLEGVQKSWVAQTLVDGGRPLRDLDSEEVAPMIGVDPAWRLWRNGAWVAPPPATPKNSTTGSKPAPAEPGSTKPGSAKPGSAKPGSAKPDAANPEAPNPDPISTSEATGAMPSVPAHRVA